MILLLVFDGRFCWVFSAEIDYFLQGPPFKTAWLRFVQYLNKTQSRTAWASAIVQKEWNRNKKQYCSNVKCKLELTSDIPNCSENLSKNLRIDLDWKSAMFMIAEEWSWKRYVLHYTHITSRWQRAQLPSFW